MESSLSPAQIAELVKLYIAYFNRAPEFQGIQFHIDAVTAAMANGESFADALDARADNFYDAAVSMPEQTGYSLEMTALDFVTVMYENVLLRPGFGGDAPTEKEIAYWIDRIENDEVSRGEIATEFLDAVEILKEVGTDEERKLADQVGQVLENRVVVGIEFAKEENSGDLTGEEAFEAGKAALEGIDQNNTLLVDAEDLVGADGEVAAANGGAGYDTLMVNMNGEGFTFTDADRGALNENFAGTATGTVYNGDGDPVRIDALNLSGIESFEKLVLQRDFEFRIAQSSSGDSSIELDLTQTDFLELEIEADMLIGGELAVSGSLNFNSVTLDGIITGTGAFPTFGTIRLDGASSLTVNTIGTIDGVTLNAETAQELILNGAAAIGEGRWGAGNYQNGIPRVVLDGADLERIEVSSNEDAWLRLGTTPNLTEFDAAGSAGSVYLDVNGQGPFIYSGGGQFDYLFNFGVNGISTDAWSIDGGAGIDTVLVQNSSVTDADEAGGINNLISVERVYFRNFDAGLTLDEAVIVQNSDIERILIGTSGSDVINNAIGDSRVYEFTQYNTGNATFNIVDGADQLNLGLNRNADVGGQYDPQVGTLTIIQEPVSGSQPLDVTLSSYGDLIRSSTIWEFVAPEATELSLIGDARLNIESIANQISLNTSQFSGRLWVVGSSIDGSDGGDIFDLSGSGHAAIGFQGGASSGVEVAGELIVDTVLKFTAGVGGDRLLSFWWADDEVQQDNQYTALDGNVQGSISNAGSLEDAAHLAATGHIADSWTAFDYNGDAYALWEDSAGSDGFESATDILVKLVGVKTEDLRQANFDWELVS